MEKRAQGTGNSNCAALSYSGALQAGLRYDPAGRLYEVTGPGTVTRMLYDGDALVGEYDTTGTLLRRYAHGADGAADDPIAWYEGAAFTLANQRVMRSDWQGSIVLVTDNNGSAVLAVNRYDEYGIPQASNAGRFQYTGQAWLAELGMYYYKARIYSPTLGRFLQTDPIGYEDQVNLYAYVGDDPINKVDPTGMQDMGAYYRGWEQVAADHGRTLPEFAEEMDRKSGLFMLGATLVPVEGIFIKGIGILGRPILSNMPRAFRIAAAGGAHSGFLRNYAGRSQAEIRKGINGLTRQIAEHREKLKDPARFVKDWDKRSPEYKKGIIEKWKRDISRQSDQRDILRGLDKLRDQCTGTRICQ